MSATNAPAKIRLRASLTAVALLAIVVATAGCSSDASGDATAGDSVSADDPGDGSTFGDIVGNETSSCFSLALTASQIPVVSSGPDASESDLDDSIATLDGVLPEELHDELAAMAAMARDALVLNDTAAADLFDSEAYSAAATPVIDYLHDACE